MRMGVGGKEERKNQKLTRIARKQGAGSCRDGREVKQKRKRKEGRKVSITWWEEGRVERGHQIACGECLQMSHSPMLKLALPLKS